MSKINFSWRQVGPSWLAGLLIVCGLQVRAEHKDIAVLPEGMGRTIVLNQGAGQISQAVAELLQQLEQLTKITQAGDDEGDAKRMMVEAKRHELRRLRKDIQADLAHMRGRLVALGHVGKVADWDQFVAQVNVRFDRLDKALGAVDREKVAQGRLRRDGFNHLRSELQSLHGKLSGAPFSADGPPATFQRGTPPSQRTLTPSKNVPAYEVSRRQALDAWRGAQMASLGDAVGLLALAPPTPPEAASCNYQPADLAATPDAQQTTEIKNLAEQLNYSPARIYEYVYNNIQFQPYLGSLKGAQATLQSKAGGSTDQASLMVALLRASNIPARYVTGLVRIEEATPDAKGGKVAQWVGAKSYAAAKEIFNIGRFSPALLQNENAQNNGVRIQQVWVAACIPYGNYRGSAIDNSGERWVPFDPSFKFKSYQSGLVNDQIFDYTTYLAKRSNGPDSLPHEAYRLQVEGALRATDPNATVQDVPYAGSIDPLNLDILPTSLPYEVFQYINWSGTSSPEAAQLPDAHRYKLYIGGLNLASRFSVYMPDIALSRLTLSFKGYTPGDQSLLNAWMGQSIGTAVPCAVNTVPSIRIEGVEQALQLTPSTSIGFCSSSNSLTMEVGLGDFAAGVTAADPNNVGRLNNASYTNIGAANWHALQAYAFQASNNLIAQRVEKLTSSVATNANPNSSAATLDATEGEFLHVVGLKYMRYITEAGKEIAALQGASDGSGNHLALTSSQMKVQYIFDLPFAVSRSGFLVDVGKGSFSPYNLVDGQFSYKTFKLMGYVGSAYESYVWQENSKFDAVSTVRGLQYAKEKGIPIYVATSANWSTIRPQLTVHAGASANDCTQSGVSYPRCVIDTTIQNLINQGHTVTLPKTLIQYEDWRGVVYIAENFAEGVNPSMNLAINRYGGGWTLGSELFVNDYLANIGLGTASNYVAPLELPSFFQTLPALSDTVDYSASMTLPAINGASALTVFSGDPVNVVSGNLYHNETDISIKGRGGLPIVFTRAYNSRNPVDGPLGYGWTHSFNAKLKFYGVEGGKAKLSWIDGTGAERFFATASHTSGDVTAGTTIPNPAGVFISFQRLADGTFTIQEKNGLKYTFSSVAGPSAAPSATTSPTYAQLQSITDRNGNPITLSYAATTDCAGGTLLCKVSAAPRGTVLSFSYSGNHITRVQDFSGRSYQYAYTDGGNNLTGFKNPLAVAGQQNGVSYSYFTDIDGQGLAHLMKQYTLPRGNGMRFEYYANGRVFRHTAVLLDGSLSPDQINLFTYNDFRRETVQTTERGGEKRFFFDPYGNTIKTTDENGATNFYTYDCDPAQTLGSAQCLNPYNRLSETNAAGYKTQYTYTTTGDVSTVTPPRGATAATSLYDYNAFGRPRRIKNGRGHWTIQRYDTAGNLTDVIRTVAAYTPAACSGECAIPSAANILAWTVNGYDSVGNQTSSKQVRDFASQIASNTPTSNTGPLLTFGYSSGQLNITSQARIGIKNADTTATTVNSATTLNYDTLGRLISGVDADWYPTKFKFDQLDRIEQATDSLGKLRTYRYDANGNPVGQTLAETDYTRSLIDSSSARFDDADRVLASLDAGGFATAYAYDATNNLVSTTNPDNFTLKVDYDLANRQIRAFDQHGHAVTTTRDTSGRTRAVTDPNGNAVTHKYWDASRDGRLRSITYPRIYNAFGANLTSGRAIEYDYDAAGNVIKTTQVPAAGSGQLNRVTSTTYDELNRPTRIVGPQYTDATHGAVCPVTSYTYSTLGQVTKVEAGHTPSPCTNASGDIKTTQQTNEFDDFGRKTKSTDALNRSWTHVYDANNNLQSSTDPKGQTTAYTWGTGHQLQSRTEHGGRITQYNRNSLGQLIELSHPEATYSYTYDAAHRLISVRDSRGAKKLTYNWSPGGLLNSVNDSDGRTTTYLYDPVGRLTQITAPNGDTFAFEFDPGGRLRQRVSSKGLLTYFGYHEDNSLWGVQNLKDMTAAVVSQHFYGYDGVGNRTVVQDYNGGVNIVSQHTYDELNRLTKVDNGTASQLETYTYDAVGNRLSKSVGQSSPVVTAFKHDAANQLTEVRNGSLTGTLQSSLSYDANGNISSDGTRSYTWDALDQLSQVSLGATTVNYTYDALGRRIKKLTGGATTQWLYDGQDIYSEYPGSWATPTAVYTHGGGIDTPLMRTLSTGAASYGQASYYFADGLGSIVAQTNSANTTVLQQRFDAWGTKLSGTIPQSAQYGFAGREPDETGLVYMRARYYNPALGRFISRDPIGLQGGLNPYAYVGNNPVNYTDPSGLLPQSPLVNLNNGSSYYSTGTQVAGLSPSIGPSPANFFTDTMVGRAVGGMAAPIALFTPNNVNPLTGYVENFNGDNRAAAAIGLVTLGVGAEVRGQGAAIKSLAETGVPLLRQGYVNAVSELSAAGNSLRAAGAGVEDIARALHAERRAIGEEFKALTPVDKLTEIYQRNATKYGDKLGPTIDWLRSQGKSWDQIIESAGRTGGKDLGF